MSVFRTILADPPWDIQCMGKFSRTRHGRPAHLPYKTQSLEWIKSLPVATYAERGAHLWLWTTNSHLRPAFDVMDAWGFKYLNTITWVKPSGMGAWFVNRTQHLLFGYRGKCQFNRARYEPTVLFADIVHGKRGTGHSVKPEASYQLIERVSDPARIELFARRRRPGWFTWGNELVNDIDLEEAS